MSVLSNLKKYLKEQAALIRATKKELKDYQKANAGHDGGRFFVLKNLSWDYRHHHIAYSLLKGKLYEVIEKPREDNKPDTQLIQRIKDAHTAKDVCVSAS